MSSAQPSSQPATPEQVPPLNGEDPLALAAYNQNYATFRSLNALMWQIPLIAMTLTGGLWFGVSHVDNAPELRVGLLGLAAIGDLGLIVVLARLRYILERYLVWLEEAHPRGFVGAQGAKWYNAPETVRRAFQVMLFLAAVTSTVLLVMTWPR